MTNKTIFFRMFVRITRFLMGAYLYETKVANTMIILAIMGVKTKINEKLELPQLVKWTPNEKIRPHNWSQTEWEKLCNDTITIKMLENVKQEKTEG